VSDDVERRIRDALRSTPLPAAPDSLRATLLEIAADTSVAHKREDRARRWLIPAAILAALVVALAGIVGTGRQHAPGPSVGATAGPTGTDVAQVTDVPVMTTAELKAAIAAERAGSLAPRVVVADVAIDASRQTPPLTRECVPVGTCQVIGTLDGFGDPVGTVTIRQAEFVVPPPVGSADLRPPIALRLSGTGPIEVLGHVTLNGGPTTSSVAEGLAATATAADGQVIAVDGWLEGTGGGWSCGPAPASGPPIPEPFRCHVTPMLMPDPVKPVTASGNSRQLSFPNGSIPVQEGAYEEYAANPASDGTNDEPRYGLYLLRMVVHDAVNCPGCRGWLVVGRLDPGTTPAPTSSPAVGVTVRSAAELAAVLGADRTRWIGRPIFVDGQVTPIFGTACESSSTCAIGILDRTTEQVVATASTRSLLLRDTDYPINGVMAMIVREQGLEYLGWMGYNNDNTFVFAVSDLQDPQHMARGPETVVVEGWLVDAPGPFACPAQLSPPPPSDTPFGNCGGAWITRDEVQPVTVIPGGSAFTAPANAIRVPPAAYTEFALDPALEANGVAHVPRHGTYLVRLVSNPPSAADPQRGWQVVARLAP
jgi:hypothetical protein